VTAAASYPAEVIAAWSGKLALALYARVIEAGQMFVAEEGGQVVGFGQLNPDNGSIDAVHVDPAVQRRGVGAALLAEAERRARQAGCDVVHAVSSLNAAPFYARG
jgi:GNAT superfamily N-acetyltransferase